MAFGLISLIITIAAVAVSSIQQRKAKKQAAKDQAKANAVQLSGHDSNRGLYVVYGRQLVGSTVVYKGLTNKQVYPATPAGFVKLSNETQGVTQNGTRGRRNLYRAVAICAGPVEAIENVVIDGTGYQDDRFSVRTNVHWDCYAHNGDGTNNYFSAWSAAGDTASNPDVLTRWDSTKKASNVAMAYENMYLHGKSPAFQGEPQTQYVVKGRKVYDPRLDSTQAGGSGTHRHNDPATWAYSTNPALCVLDYLTDTEYGKAIDISDIDIASFQTRADDCDVNVSIPAKLTNDTGTTKTYYDPLTGQRVTVTNTSEIDVYRQEQVGTTQKRFSMNIVLDPASSILENLEDMLDCFKASLLYVNGKYMLHMDGAEASVMSITDDDITGGLKINNGDQSQRLNHLKINFTNSNKQFKQDTVAWPPLDSATYSSFLATDGNIPLHQEITVNGITDFYQVEDLAEFIVRDSRNTLTLQMQVTPRLAVLVPGDVVDVTTDFGNFSSKYFRVSAVNINADTLAVSLSLREYDSSVYTWDASRNNEPLGYAWDWALYNDVLPAVTGLVATGSINTGADGSTNNVIDVSWDEIVDAEVDRLEILYSPTTLNTWQTIVITNPDTQTATDFMVPNADTTYDVVVRYKALGGAGNEQMISADATTTATIPALDSTVLATSAFISWTGAWNSGTAYEVDDVVRYTDGRAYIAILAHTNQAPSGTGADNTYWQLFVDAGGDGQPGDSVDIVFARSASQPTATGTTNPPGGSVTWYTNVNSVPAGSDPMWSAVGKSTDGGTTWAWETPLQVEGSDGTNGADGGDGLSVAELSVFRRDTSTPATPTGGSFNFDTQTLTAPTNWTTGPAVGSDPLYISRGVASVTGTTGTDSSITWTSPVLFVSDGADGVNGIPGLPGASVVLDYDDLNTGGAMNGDYGTYKFTNTGDSNPASESGKSTWADVTSGNIGYLHLRQLDADNVDQSDYFGELQVGDVIVWYDETRRWIDFRITGTPVDNTTTWTFPVTVAEYDDNDGTQNGNITTATDPVTFRFSRALQGAQGTAGTNGTNGVDGNPGLPGASTVYTYQQMYPNVPASNGDYGFYNGVGGVWNNTWALLTGNTTDRLYLRHTDKDGKNITNFLDTIQEGTTITWYEGPGRWVEFLVGAGGGTGGFIDPVWRWIPVSYLEHNEGGGTQDPVKWPSLADVDLRFSSGGDGQPGLPGGAHIIKYTDSNSGLVGDSETGVVYNLVRNTTDGAVTTGTGANSWLDITGRTVNPVTHLRLQANNQAGYLRSVIVGDHITFYDVANNVPGRWVEYRVTGVNSSTYTYTIIYAVDIVEYFDNGDSTTINSLDPGNDVNFMFSRAKDGRPGLPGASTILVYDEARSGTETMTTLGQYKFSDNSNPSAGGTLTWSAITGGTFVTHIHLNDADDFGVDQSAYLAELVNGDVITWYESERRWVEYRISGTPSETSGVFTFPVTLVEFDEADGIGNLSGAANLQRDFRFSRAPRGADGANGTNGTNGTDGADGDNGANFVNWMMGREGKSYASMANLHFDASDIYASGATVSMGNLVYKVGYQSVKLDSPASGTYGYLSFQPDNGTTENPMILPTGRRWLASAWVRQNVNANIALYLNRYTGSTTEYSSIVNKVTTSTNTWTQLWWLLDLTSTYSTREDWSIALRWQHNGVSGRNLYIDGVMLLDVTDTPQYTHTSPPDISFIETNVGSLSVEDTAIIQGQSISWYSHGTVISDYSPPNTSQTATVNVKNIRGETIATRTVVGTVSPGDGLITVTSTPTTVDGITLTTSGQNSSAVTCTLTYNDATTKISFTCNAVTGGAGGK